MKVPFGSEKYQEAPLDEVKAVCTGCGNMVTMFLNAIMGVDIRPACCAHDYEYIFKTVPRAVADGYFLMNLQYLIKRAELSESDQARALLIARGYYLAVRKFGWLFY